MIGPGSGGIDRPSDREGHSGVLLELVWLETLFVSVAFMLGSMTYYLGLDAGGTRTECALAQDDTILARASGGTIKILRTSTADAEKSLEDLLQSVSRQSGVALDSIACTCVGLSGFSVSWVADWVRQALHARLSGDVLLAGDEEIALDAAFSGGAGVLVVAGTGSNLIGRSRDGRVIHVGGWGPALADEGAGSWIGKQAVRAIFDALDRDATTLLLKKVLQAWVLPDVGSLIDRANQIPEPDFSGLTPIVVECAQLGDAYATGVLKRGGEFLGMFAALAVQRVRKLDGASAAPCEVAFTGSILRQIAPVREAMFAAIRHEIPAVRIRTEAVDSVQGALWRARQHCRPKLGTHSG